MASKKICIAGKNLIAIKGLEYIVEYGIHKEDIVCLTNQNDQGIDSWQPSFKKYCLENEFQLGSLQEIYNEENLLFFSLEFDKIIKTEKFKSNKLYNIHFSLLPKYRGMYTSAMPLLNGEKISGVTLHVIDDGIDTGDIISQKEFDINSLKNAYQLYLEYLKYGEIIFKENFDNVYKGEYKSIAQSMADATYYSKSAIDFKNINIDFNQTAFQVFNQLRAFSFEPFQLPVIAEKRIIDFEVTGFKCFEKPGKILEMNQNSFLISTIDYAVRLYV